MIYIVVVIIFVVIIIVIVADIIIVIIPYVIRIASVLITHTLYFKVLGRVTEKLKLQKDGVVISNK